ncbi:MAG TPA: substrate-binding domain-containing protein, partial [Bacillota bacterium]|nr:substrate-binding domain-containing protein [Bacillota bacterium]
MENCKTVAYSTVAYIAHDISETIGLGRYMGIADETRELNVSLFCVVQGNHLDNLSTSESENNNILYQLLAKHTDGLICGISSTNRLKSSEELAKLMDQFKVPKVSVSNLNNIPYITFDNYQMMKVVLSHLIQVHGYKRIFHARGPANHCVADERYQAFRDTMMEYGCFDPKLVSLPLNWDPKQNALTVDQLLEGLQPGRDIEAIVAANDMWALEF